MHYWNGNMAAQREKGNKTDYFQSQFWPLIPFMALRLPFCLNLSLFCQHINLNSTPHRDCNRCSAVLVPFNEFYAATYYHLYSIWKSQHKTIADTGYVIKGTHTDCYRTAVFVNNVKNLFISPLYLDWLWWEIFIKVQENGGTFGPC